MPVRSIITGIFLLFAASQSCFCQQDERANMDEYKKVMGEHFKERPDPQSVRSPELVSQQRRLKDIERQKEQTIVQLQSKKISKEIAVSKLRLLVAEELTIKQSKEYLIEQEVQNLLLKCSNGRIHESPERIAAEN
jgi:hypothetical protein